MNADHYNQIIALKQERSNSERDRYFSQLIREIMPWELRPPIFSRSKQSQARIYGHGGMSYLVCTTALKTTILPGMSEWDDFEQQVRDRKTEETIGLYFSLFDAAPELIEAGQALTRQGTPVLIINGDDWNQLASTGIYFPSFLEYLTLQSRSGKSVISGPFEQVTKWIGDSRLIDEKFSSVSRKASAPFLRRFKHKFHEKLFINREIDRQIRRLSETVRPLYLRAKVKKDTARQVIVIRDYSGSGKTTLSVNFASHNEDAYCICVSANLSEVDKVLQPFFEQLNYPHFGIPELQAVNKPLLLIIDSLDETPQALHVHKRAEIKRLLKYIDVLNAEASLRNLAMYPIMIIFTVREDYWRDWEAVFEGREELAEFKRMISSFTSGEFPRALERYEHAYDYSITHLLSREAAGILSIPIHLEIFSEANHFEGDITVSDIWEGKILSSFFDKKEQLIGKHTILHFNEYAFYRVLGLVAFELLAGKTTLFTKSQFQNLIQDHIPALVLSSERILQQLLSEQIFTTDNEEHRNYRFRYTRFIEYIAAFYIIQEVERTGEYSKIDELLKIIYDSNIISIFSVFNNLKHISKTRNNQMHEAIVNYYVKSETFLNKYLPELRGRIGRGETISNEDIREIIANTYTPSPFTSWHTFFIVAASRQQFSSEILLSAFKLAWENNRDNEKRWRLIQKLAQRKLLINETLLLTLLHDGTPREWEEYLGQVLETSVNESFMDLWDQLGGDTALMTLSHASLVDWQLSHHLLKLIARNEKLEPGAVLDPAGETEYTVFPQKRFKRKIKLSEGERSVLDSFVQDIKRCLEGKAAKYIHSAPRFQQLEKEPLQYLNQELDDIVNAVYEPDAQPFINHLLSHHSKEYNLLRTLLESRGIAFDLQGKDQHRRTALMEITDHAEHKATYFELLFNRGYRKNAEDDTFFQDKLTDPATLDKTMLEDLLLSYCYYKVTDPQDRLKISQVIKPIYILYCFKYRRVISYNFSKMIQVVHLALESYGQYEELFIRALHVYGLYEEMNKIPSFRTKMEKQKQRQIRQETTFNHLFEIMFPRLFQ